MTEQTQAESTARQRQQLAADLRARIARQSDQIAEGARDLAQILAEIPRDRLDMTQVRNLENLAYSTDKVSDLTDLVKKLIGRDTRGDRWARTGVGAALLEALDGLRHPADQIASGLKKYKDAWDNDLARRVHLALCREYVRHLVASFEYYRQARLASLESEVER